MARFFDGSDDVIRWSIGGLASTTANATIVAVLKRSSASTFDSILGLHNSGGTVQQWLQIEDVDRLQFGHAIGNQTSSFTVMTTDNWVLVAAGKASGTATPRFHKYVYSTGTWTHEDAGGTLTDGSSAGAGGYAETSWQGGDLYHGDIAAVGVWAGQNLTDAQVENLAFSFAHWTAAAPTAMWLLDQSATTQNVPDRTGGGADQTSITGTTVSGGSVPVLGYGASPVVVTRDQGAVTVQVGQAAEADTAFPLADLIAVGQSPEADTAGIVTPAKARVVAIGQATETDTATTVAHSKAVTVGQALEADTAQQVAAGETHPLGQAEEADTAGVITPDKRPVVSYLIEIDWDADGFGDDVDDVTTRTLERGSFAVEFGRDQARSLSPMASGRASLEIDNTSRDYSPDNLASPLYGRILPARPLRIQASSEGVTYTLFRGHLDDFEVLPGREHRSVSITGLDPLAKLKDATASTLLYQGIRTGTAIGYVLDAIDWPSADRDLDPGATTIRWWWEEQGDAFEAIQRLVASEGPGAFVHADETGKVVFRDRHHRLTRSASTTAQATFTASEAPAFNDLAYDHGWRDIVNNIVIKVEERDPSPEPETVWESADIRNIEASATLTIVVELNDPVIDPSLSYTTLAGSVTTDIVQSSGQKLTLELTAGGSAAAVSELVVTGQPVTVRRSYQIASEDTASRDKYGMRALPYEAPWAGVHDADAIGQLILGARAERTPIVTMSLVSGTWRASERLTQQLGRDLSDRVHLREDQTGLNHNFYIEQIKHKAAQAGLVLETEFGMERANAHPDNVFVFDKAGAGWDDGVFGQVGLDDPVLLFRFDVADQGFNDGVFAT